MRLSLNRLHDKFSEEWLQANEKLDELRRSEKTAGEEWEIAAENEWLWTTALEKLESIADIAAKYLPLR